MFDEFVYVLQAGPYYKIGRTRNLTRRVSTIALQMPFEIVLFKVISTDDSHSLESYLHDRYSQERANGEWFELCEENAHELFMFPPTVRWDKGKDRLEKQIEYMFSITEHHAEKRRQERERERLLEQHKDDAEMFTGADIGGACDPTNLLAECPYPTRVNEFGEIEIVDA